MNHEALENLSVELFTVKCVKFGKFTLKSGLESPIYLDLRTLISYPKSLHRVAQALSQKALEIGASSFDRIGAVPITGLILAEAMCLRTDWPVVFTRPPKDHGTGKSVEAIYEVGDRILLIDDLITQGHSKFEAILPLEQVGLKVKDVLVVLDREQGGSEELAAKGYQLHSIMTLRKLVRILYEKSCISLEQTQEVDEYLEKSSGH